MPIRFFRWYGGKNRMLEKLIPLIPEHKIYLEPFVGSGALALNHIRSSVEVINDLDRDISNLYRVMADRGKGKELITRLLKVPYDRKIFNAVRNEQKNHFMGYSSVERAVMTYIVISQSYNGARSSFSEGGYASTELYHQDMRNNLPKVYERLEGVKIYNADALDVLSCYADNHETFAFLDPPYRHDLRGRNADKVYKCEMSELQQIKLLNVIRNSKAKILLCGYKEERGIDLYDAYLLSYGWKCYELMKVPKSSQNKEKKDYATEYVWCNYELPIGSGGHTSLKEHSTLKNIMGGL